MIIFHQQSHLMCFQTGCMAGQGYYQKLKEIIIVDMRLVAATKGTSTAPLVFQDDHILGVGPPSQDSSDHKDYSMFSRGSIHKP